MRSSPRALLGAGLALALVGCGAGETGKVRHRGPMVLITIGSLRADAVGALGGPAGLTPHLDALMAEADWAGRAVAPSSRTVSAMASLFTGLQPWKHQVLHPESPWLRPQLFTLPEALKRQGVLTSGYPDGYWVQERFGYDQGFDFFRPLRQGKRTEGHLAHLGEEAAFVWVDLAGPEAPYLRHRQFLPRLPAVPENLPSRIEAADLARYADPQVGLSEETRRFFLALYFLSVARTDEELGRYLGALRQSGRWDETLLVVTSGHGVEFGEHGSVGHGEDLGRAVLEVPVVIKLPRGYPRTLALSQGDRVAAVRLWATLVEAAGGHPPPGVAPSLFRQGPAGILSELYLTNGVNAFSLLEDPYQLHWQARFAPPEPEYFRARVAHFGGAPRPPLREPPEVLFGRLYRAFLAAPPLTGREHPPELRLERWTSTGTEPVDDPERLGAMARRLREAWLAFLPAELTPEETLLRWFGETNEPAESR